MKRDTAYISRTMATKRVRAATGLSVAICKMRVNQLPVKQDGLRWKVSASQVRKLIAEMSAPPTLAGIGIKPLSAKHLAIARATATTNQVIDRLRERMTA